MMPTKIQKTNDRIYLKILRTEVYRPYIIDTDQDQLDGKASPGQGTSHLSRQIPTKVNLH